LDIGLRDYQITSPSGLLYGQRAAQLLRETFGMVPVLSSFDQLSIPYRAIATDLSRNEQVTLDRGDLLSAMRASANVPGVLAPVNWEGQLLVDGGLVNNVPIDVVKQMGADIVIAVDIGDELAKPEALTDTVSILGQLSNFLTVASTEKQKAHLGAEDILIKPDIDNLSTTDWSTFNLGIQEGLDATEYHLLSLQALSLSEAEYQSYLLAKERVKNRLVRVQDEEFKQIRIDNQSNAHQNIISENLDLKAGEKLNPSQLNQALSRVYSLDEFQRVDARIIPENDQHSVIVTAEGKDWGPNFLEFGLGWETNFTDQSKTDLDLAYTATNLSVNGGEWRSQLELGSDPELNTELYWPLTKSRTFYTLGRYAFESVDWRLLDLNVLPLTVEQNIHQLRAGLGFNFSRNGILEVGGLAEVGSLDNDYLLSKKINYDTYGAYLKLGYDSLNSASFPTEGNRIELSLIHKEEDADNVTLQDGGQSDFGVQSTQLGFEWKGAISIDSHAFVGKAAFNKMFVDDGEHSVNNATLGGFLNLSGFNERDLSGPHKAFMALIYQYDLRGGFIRKTGLPLYVGLSAEAGNVWRQDEKVDLEELIYGGSIYLGTDTIMGPVALGYGANDHGASSVYFYLGYEL
jgi:NTE family protein